MFDGKKPIRGGIPFVFPVFGSSTILPQHGFARIARWQLEKGPERLHTGDIEAIFSLTDTDFTRQMWNCQFRVSYRLILREKELHMNIGVYNPSKEIPFNFNLLLHTYFKCPDVRRCQVTGLHGCTFIDKTREPPNSYQVSHLPINSYSLFFKIALSMSDMEFFFIYLFKDKNSIPFLDNVFNLGLIATRYLT